MKLIFTILLLVTSYAAVSADKDQQSFSELEKEFCNRSAIEVAIQSDIFETAVYSDVLVQLLSGNSKEAGETLGSWLALNVMYLGKAIKNKPCNIKQEELDKIYPILRVVAAIHEQTPISALIDNKEAMDILQDAIQDNPQHYKQTVKRSQQWENGIK
ncbi:MAG: hypothetical protein N0C84_20460 [Candidatus Thiodiazotropha taylori]|uniref:Secreted protein n=1 Tax=Candidatus Thiodiazotropha taylori TaxID=2792791 RepID=A0A9E4N760_9GAMM|nr:hypothetical protein [Candidatus Thiodiazotropha taylori]MCW4258842.1 hypothetical protein [Candidatus Thiodiazotropha taylori]